MSAALINWPNDFIPGDTENFVANEVVVKHVSASDVWPHLIDSAQWPSYCEHKISASFPNNDGPKLNLYKEFELENFGIPLTAKVEEFVPPSMVDVARLSWRATATDSDGKDQDLQVYHAWLIEDLPGYRVRIVLHQVQRGKLATELASTRPNLLLNGHQDWLEGLVRSTKKLVKE